MAGMDIGDVLKDFAEYMNERNSVQARTTEGIRSELIHGIAVSRKISGTHDFATGMEKVIHAMLTNAEFKQALTTVAETTLLLFPNKEESSTASRGVPANEQVRSLN